MNNQPKVAVLGGGSWATAIVKMLCENLETVGWYMRSIYATEHIKLNKHNKTNRLIFLKKASKK
jgi:glycerol-3-phosphate dehydrogenase (NAD(P)+)